ncbi:ATP-dependent zinc metalloprotease FtsH [Pyrinomonas methylaliphatogenes]|uniref:ATP-dependent zinc metalloprotease FtsH n=1 Tax=Pyrinomonas methylaliphatogenes TaxID=454194 RepID=A0A0B6WY18_9BACT|nr:ATP-dependent zinc metalloprotease FtsH [Pyrinomonas methylaliphatogenes]CDM66011.1 membrane protease FtsH catalytic subunit [Pyrinomonas methylaliphatogenes]
MNSTAKQIVVWVLIIMGALLLYRLFAGTAGRDAKQLPISDLVAKIKKNEITELTIKQSEVVATDGKQTWHTPLANEQFKADLMKLASEPNERGEQRVRVEEEVSGNSAIWTMVLYWAPLIFLIAIWIFMMRQIQAGGNKALSFGKARAKLLNNQQKRVTFKDVAGVDEAKEELQEIIEFLKEPQKFQKLGGRIPKGVLMVGPPGTGKTLLARAVAGEANVPFFSISGSDFVEMFVGVGASRVRDLFEQGKKNAPCIIFIDEIDAVGRHRGAGLGGGHDEREQTLNQLLVEMDGFESNDGVIIMASTNRPDVLDPALLRPGRFDRRVVVSRPDVRGREGILKVHTRKIPLGDDVDISVIARGTPGFTGADLANLVNEAALNAARNNRKVVTMADFELAKDKVLMGAERRSMVISNEEKRVTAYHEAGHALVGLKVPNADPVHKVTIIPRGMALGVTQQLPEGDRHNYTKEYLLGQIAILMGGRVAEEVFLGSITTGAANDLERATELARAMVCEYGMSDLGPLTFGKREEQIFLGREIAQHRDFSEDTAIKIDQEVKKIITEQYERAKKIILENREAMIRLSEALLERETLDAVQIRRIVAGLPLDDDEPPTSDGDSASKVKEKEATPTVPKLKPILPPITGSNPATA